MPRSREIWFYPLCAHLVYFVYVRSQVCNLLLRESGPKQFHSFSVHIFSWVLLKQSNQEVSHLSLLKCRKIYMITPPGSGKISISELCTLNNDNSEKIRLSHILFISQFFLYAKIFVSTMGTATLAQAVMYSQFC